MKCESEKYISRLIVGNVDDKTLLNIEILLKLRCDKFKLLEKVYNKYCIF